MRTNRATAVAALGLAAALTGTLAVTGPAALGAEVPGASAPAEEDTADTRADFAAIGITDTDRLVSFETQFPRKVTRIGKVQLSEDDAVIGIDYRVQNALLYAVGDSGGIYTVSTEDASSIKVSQLSVDLAGSVFGVDFNPAADRLRIISDTGQNLRHDLNTDTTTVDGDLTYPAVPPDDPTPGIGITAAAYTNNDLDANTGTTLFDIDTMLDQVVVQAPANAGLLSAAGKLRVDAGTNAGFDIYTKIRDGRAFENEGYATLSVDGRYQLFKVRLLTGEVQRTRGFSERAQVVDITLLLDQR